MKRILLLGDSIRMGYDKKVRELLKEEYEVFFAEDDNGRFAAYTLWQANQFFKQYGRFDLVHWNNGYWDMNIEAPMKEPIHPLEEYVSYLKRIIRLCRENGARVIFATTMPIYDGGDIKDNMGTGDFLQYRNDWVKEYNAVACSVMEEEKIPVNDLYTLCLEGPKYYKCEDMLHLTDVGYNKVAEQTVEMIRQNVEKC